VTLTFRKRPGGRLELATNHQGPPRSTITASGTRPQVGDADTTCCSAAALTPLTRRGMGVVRGLAAGSATAPFARAEPEPRLVTAVRYRLRLAVATAARPTPPAALLREAEPRGLSSNELLAVAERHWPQPRLVPDPAGPGNAGGRLRPLGLDPPATPPGHRPGRAGAPAVIGLGRRAVSGDDGPASRQTATRERPR
jgi:hypothetical protein